MKRMRAALTVAAALALGCAAGLFAFHQSILPNLRIVRAGVLWRSGQPNALGLRIAHWAGIRTIVCLRDGSDPEVREEAAFARRHGIAFVLNPLRFSGENLDAAVRRFLDAVAETSRRPVLVHCARGKERSGVCAAVFRIEFDGWTSDQALREMYALGFEPGSLPELERFVATYQPQRPELGPDGQAARGSLPLLGWLPEPQEGKAAP